MITVSWTTRSNASVGLHIFTCGIWVPFVIPSQRRQPLNWSIHSSLHVLITAIHFSLAYQTLGEHHCSEFSILQPDLFHVLSIQNHITHILKSLHWLPIKHRIRFKVLLMTYRAINRLAPSYLCGLVGSDIKERNLRSRHQHRPKLQNSRRICYGDRSFKAAAPKQWNKLPLNIRQSPTVDCFKSRLKPTYLIYVISNCHLFLFVRSAFLFICFFTMNSLHH